MSGRNDAPRVISGVAQFDEMAWPHPGHALDERGWRLRYGSATQSDLLFAAEVISAYQALIDKPATQRNYIIRMLREAEQIADGARGSHG